jgi:prefoldin subunit 5
MLRIESTIDRCINRLNERVRSISSDHGYLNDDVESVTSADGASFSLASSSKAPTRYLSQVHKETETLRSKVKSLEQENQDLRRRLDQLQQALGQAISI